MKEIKQIIEELYNFHQQMNGEMLANTYGLRMTRYEGDEGGQVYVFHYCEYETFSQPSFLKFTYTFDGTIELLDSNQQLCRIAMDAIIREVHQKVCPSRIVPPPPSPPPPRQLKFR